ncbi:lysophospholipid acyltransferase LPEAT2 [Sesbania bispinosa]|nr:lysophospholipid acyltransferase LPEAT2 [Sesbania bispinosa]
MADHDITSPLLSSDHLIVTVQEADADDSASSVGASPNPFRAVGCERELTVPAAITVDPFRNDKARIEGVYEWVKTVVCVPLALVRLVLFGLCLAVGYVATKLALEGWKDKDNPMPRWRMGEGDERWKQQEMLVMVEWGIDKKQ